MKKIMLQYGCKWQDTSEKEGYSKLIL